MRESNISDGASQEIKDTGTYRKPLLIFHSKHSYSTANRAIMKCKPLQTSILQISRWIVVHFWLFVQAVAEGQIGRITSSLSSPRLAAQITRGSMPAADQRGSVKCASGAACLRHASALPSQEPTDLPPFLSCLLLCSGLCLGFSTSLSSPARLEGEGDRTTHIYITSGTVVA